MLVILRQNENVIWQGKPSIRLFLPAAAVMLLIIAGVWTAIANLLPAEHGLEISRLVWVVVGALMTIVGIKILRSTKGSQVEISNAIASRATDYLVTSERIAIKVGILSRDFAEEDLVRIRTEVDIHQGLWQSILGIGDISLISTTNKAYTLTSVTNPVRLTDEILNAVLARRKELGVIIRD